MKNSKFKINKLLHWAKCTLFFTILLNSCHHNAQSFKNNNSEIIVGANQTELYFPLLKNKRIGVITNHTGLLLKHNQPIAHLVDTLLNANFKIEAIFTPEHGFLGTADAGQWIADTEKKESFPRIVSLYGKNKKPSVNQLKNIDILLFDLQDVGVRFFTYISTLHYVMESASENNIPMIILDRPNPNAHYIDGSVLQMPFQSFVGIHRVPIVYGMTIGEFAQMINKEQWLSNKKQCHLTVVPLKNYTHSTPYSLPVKPSPNLPNDKAINLYPSLCLFEGTNVSVGRGTDMPFEIYGSPYLNRTDFHFIPMSRQGATDPKHKGKICYGENLTLYPRLSKIELNWLIKAFEENSSTKNSFFNTFFNKLAGNDILKLQIEKKLTPEQIRESWKKDIEQFKLIRKKYLLYP